MSYLFRKRKRFQCTIRSRKDYPNSSYCCMFDFFSSKCYSVFIEIFEMWQEIWRICRTKLFGNKIEIFFFDELSLESIVD